MNHIQNNKRGALQLCALLVLALSPMLASANDEAVSKDITTLFRSARKVISDNQDLINDASKGDKGLNSAKVLEVTKANYKEAAKVDLVTTGDGGAAKQALLDAIKSVMDEAQSMINVQGKGFKGFLPAVFGARVAGKFSATMAGKFKIKLTAPKDFVRNRANRPDEWENKIIEESFRNASWEHGKAFGENSTVDGKASYRYILPEYYGPSCLSCHGEPKGEMDITGAKKEGAKLNDLGGAVSLVIFQ